MSSIPVRSPHPPFNPTRAVTVNHNTGFLSSYTMPDVSEDSFKSVISLHFLFEISLTSFMFHLLEPIHGAEMDKIIPVSGGQQECLRGINRCYGKFLLQSPRNRNHVLREVNHFQFPREDDHQIIPLYVICIRHGR